MSDTSLIDDLIRRFFAAFDNRAGRRPDAGELTALFDPDARITRVDGTAEAPGVTQMTVSEFVEPRVALLTDGPLRDFHEWETQADTTIRGAIAVRVCDYAKQGLFEDADYSGTGHKVIALRRAETGWLIHSVLWEDDPVA